MSLQISPMSEDDVATYVRIRHEAFKNTINRIFYARELSPESETKIADGILEALRNDKHTHYLKATDTATGEMVACAKWKIFERQRSPEELDAELALPDPLPESDVPTWNAFFTDLSDARREVMGPRPYFFLDLLVTHPDHHRRGAGSMLIAWGTAQADEMGLDAYLEASEMGLPLYERHGFDNVKVLHFDLARFGGGGDFRHMVGLSRVGKISKIYLSYAAAFLNALWNDTSIIIGLQGVFMHVEASKEVHDVFLTNCFVKSSNSTNFFR